MKEFLRENLTYFALLFACFMGARSVIKDFPNTPLYRYCKMPDEEKALYDKEKVKRVELFWVLSVATVTILAFVFERVFPGIVSPKIFVNCFFAELVLFLIMNTKVVLNWLCKKSESD